MSDVINLNQQRKAKARLDKEATSSQNRAKFGRTKAEKKLDAIKKDKLERHLQGHKREDDKDAPQ